MGARPAYTYPFSAIVGQSTLKTALLVNAVDPRVGGVLVRGERGTAKSTAARALASLLPPIDVVEDCSLGCDPSDPVEWCPACAERAAPSNTRTVVPAPFAELPLSATEDRLVGSLDLQRVLSDGVRSFHPGVLAAAHRGVLYVDEVNLLDDHLVDTLLDAAASGVNTVERDGISLRHPSRFVLVGTMNPEEGEVRPQLVDRFGLCVDVRGSRDTTERMEIVARRSGFEADPGAFVDSWSADDDELRADIARARGHLADVIIPEAVLRTIVQIGIAADVQGHRADQVIARGSAALAALDGDEEVAETHVRRVAPLALAHRMRRDALGRDEDVEERIAAALAAASAADRGDRADDEVDDDRSGTAAVEVTDADEHAPSTAQVPTGMPQAPHRTDVARPRVGRGSETATGSTRGRFVRSEVRAPRTAADVAVPDTVRAAAVRRQEPAGGAGLEVAPEDLRSAVRSTRPPACVVFAVDASGSMGALRRMEAAKGAVLDLLSSAYQRRDRVGVVSFRGERAETLLTPTASVELAQLKLRHLATGGSTPLADGIITALDLLETERRRTSGTVPWLVLVTDGGANVGIHGGVGSEDARAAAARIRASGVHALLLDSTTGGSAAARELAELAGAEYVRLDGDRAVTAAVSDALDRGRPRTTR